MDDGSQTEERAGEALAWRALVLGGARSGKSAYAERLARARAIGGGAVTYIATAHAFDAEMAARIATHQARRDGAWTTVEAPRDLPEAVARHAAPGAVVLVDCVTLWLSNALLSDADLAARAKDLASAVEMARGDVVLVSNEVGLSIVPENALARRFRDAQGEVNQAVAAICDYVALCAAGLPLGLKGAPPAGDLERR